MIAPEERHKIAVDPINDANDDESTACYSSSATKQTTTSTTIVVTNAKRGTDCCGNLLESSLSFSRADFDSMFAMDHQQQQATLNNSSSATGGWSPRSVHVEHQHSSSQSPPLTTSGTSDQKHALPLLVRKNNHKKKLRPMHPTPLEHPSDVEEGIFASGEQPDDGGVGRRITSKSTSSEYGTETSS